MVAPEPSAQSPGRTWLWYPPTLFLFRGERGRRAFAHDQQYGFLVLGAIPMHLLAEMRHEASGGHRGRIGGIEFRARAHPPGALDHGNEAVVGMEMRPAEMIARGPFYVDGIESRLGRIANQDSHLRAFVADRTPLNLVRQFVDHRGGIELGGGADAQHAGESDRNREVSPKPMGDRHVSSARGCV